MGPPPVELRLIPTPGAKPEFLASIQPLHHDNVPPIWRRIQNNATTTTTTTATNGGTVIVLEGYTRDDWSLDTATKWASLQVTSIDGRNKFPGFVKYLRERQKTSYGRFTLRDEDCDNDNDNDNDNVDNGGGGGGGKNSSTYVLVISYKQASSSTIACRVALLSTIPNCPLKPLLMTRPTPPLSTSGTHQSQPQQSKASSAVSLSSASISVPPVASKTTTTTTTPTTITGPPKRKGMGLLGNLVAGQRRTNELVGAATINTTKGNSGGETKQQQQQQLVGGTTAGTTTMSRASSSSSTMTTTSDDYGRDDDNDDSNNDDNQQPLKTSGQVLADFRYEMEQKMLDFDIAPDTVLKIMIQLSDHTRKVIEADKSKVTMEVLKYIVYEQAEEVNEEWITYKEPTEFLDELTVAIYKDAEDAPPEVLDDMNKVEITDEMRAQQAALQELRRQQEMRALRQQAEAQNAALRNRQSGGGTDGDNDDDDFAVLNTRKRDRRTIEDYQRENKRQRGE